MLFKWWWHTIRVSVCIWSFGFLQTSSESLDCWLSTFFSCPDKPLLCKETLPWHEGAMVLESTYWHDWRTNKTGEKGWAKLLGRMGCFSGRLFALKLNSVQCYKQVLRKRSWKCLKISVRLSHPGGWASAMGETELSGLLSALCCLLELALFHFTTWPLWRQDQRFHRAERAKRAKSWDMIKWWPYTALVQTFFCLQPWGTEQREKGYAKKQEAICSGERIRFAKIPTFAFPTNSYSMQTKFPFAKLPGLQCCQWFKLTGCT